MKTLIAANWKMHGDMSWDRKLAEFREFYPTNEKHVECLICPPAFLIPALIEQGRLYDVLVGAQNCHAETSGAFTGEISAEMVADLGASHVIVGHSERRAMFGETDAVVAAKAQSVQNAGLNPIICVGESADSRRKGEAFDIVLGQIKHSIPTEVDCSQFIIAYEPVWAIGTGLTPTLKDIDAMHNYIRALICERFGKKNGGQVQILYGGSVKPANAKDILAIKNVNGALIGGASLDMKSLAAIAKAA